ncbi:MAG: hypothetical protein EHM47_16995, partial [Ignavibacteriales bacterium]
MKKIIVDLPGKSYPVFIGETVIEKIKKEIKHPGRKIVLIDKNVERLHGSTIRNLFKGMKGDTEYFIIKKGENSKSLNELNRIYNFLLRNNTGKDSILFSIGGGVTG